MNKNVQEWLAFADRDLKAAESLLQEDYLANIVLFHCQQTIEKSLKATYSHLSVDIPRIHSTMKLFAQLPEHLRKTLDISLDLLEQLDDVYIDNRYPSGLGMLPQGFPEKELAQEIFEKTNKAYQILKEYLT